METAFPKDSILFENNPAPMFIHDMDTLEILRVNKAAINHYGYPEEEFLSLTITDLCSPQQIPDLFKNVAQSESFSGNVGIREHKKKNGNVFPAKILVQSFQYENRQVKLVQVHEVANKIDDLTEHENVEKSHRRMVSMIESTSDLVGMVDTKGKVSYLNSSGVELLEIDKDTADKFSMTDFHSPKETRRLKEEIFPHVKKYGTWSGELEFKSPTTGAVIPTSSIIICHRNEQGEIEYYSTTSRDISDHKNYEGQLKKALQEKQILLQEIHHRVKNNLAVISGLLQLESFNTDNPELQKGLLESQRRIKSMALIHEKLYQSESLSDIAFDEYVQDLSISINQALDAGNEIELVIDCDSFQLNVNQAIPCALIINELLSNAYEHGVNGKDDGQILLSIHKKNKRVSVSVKDNGSGMPEDFDPKHTSSMGFTIISTLIGQLKSDLDIKSENGARISFQFAPKDLKGSATTLFGPD